MKKEKHLTIRISNELYENLIKKALEKSNKEKKIIKLSEIIREILEKNEKI
jgi:hypothetical protein